VKLLGSFFILHNNLSFLVFTGRDDCMKYREEPDLVGRQRLASIKLAYKHMTTRKHINYQSQDVMGCHQEINQAVTLF
jgi:hypothetical protein